MGGILPWLLLAGGFALYKMASQSSTAGSSTTASNGTSVTLPGLTIPSGYVLSSDNATALRGIISGSGTGLSGDAMYVIEQEVGALGTLPAATRLTIAQRVLDDLASQMAYGGAGRTVSDAIVSLG
jgi:hypothetical protein